MTTRGRSPLPRLTLALALVAAPVAAHAQLYYGGDPNTRGAFASWINNPANTLNQPVFDNFVIGGGQTWSITGLFGNMAMSNVSPALTSLLWEIRTGMVAGSSTGTVVAGGAGAFTHVGSQFTVPVSLTLGAGTYWLSLYGDLTGVDPQPDPNDPNAQPFVGPLGTSGANGINAPGDGHSIWLVGADASNVGGSANDVDTDMGYGVLGTATSSVPEPTTWALVAGGLLALGAVRRRASA